MKAGFVNETTINSDENRGSLLNYESLLPMQAQTGKLHHTPGYSGRRAMMGGNSAELYLSSRWSVEVCSPSHTPFYFVSRGDCGVYRQMGSSRHMYSLIAWRLGAIQVVLAVALLCGPVDAAGIIYGQSKPARIMIQPTLYMNFRDCVVCV
jgi:hypothetical protein